MGLYLQDPEKGTLTQRNHRCQSRLPIPAAGPRRSGAGCSEDAEKSLLKWFQGLEESTGPSYVYACCCSFAASAAAAAAAAAAGAAGVVAAAVALAGAVAVGGGGGGGSVVVVVAVVAAALVLVLVVVEQW